MTPIGIHIAALASATAGLTRLAAAVRAWRAERRARRAFDGLSEAQLKDIGYRRIPTEPPYYQRLDPWAGW